MPEKYIEKVASAIQAVTIHGPSCFSWFGEKQALLPPKLRRVLPPETVRDHFVNTLQVRLYSHFYCKGLATPLNSQPSPPHLISANTAFTSELSHANLGNGYQEDGWLVRSLGNSHLVLQKNGLGFAVDKIDCLLPTGRLIEPGISLSMRMPKELRFFSPGFYVALSDVALTRDRDSTIVRFYWNLGPEGAIQFMQAATSALNQAALPFRLKVVNQLAGFGRCDPVILYLNKGDYSEARAALERIYPKLLPYLRRGTPAFTKALSVGLGLAEDPSPEVSFGWHRCQLVAEGMVRAYEQELKSLSERLAVVLNCFDEAVISVERPYLNPGSQDDYGFSPRPNGKQRSGTGNRRVTSSEGSGQSFLQVALDIGQRLTQAAVWHEGRCNWMGMDIYGADRYTNREDNLAYKALGPDLYSGTSGIALFLAELYAAAGDQAIRRTSLGAIRQAISLAPQLLTTGQIGLYSGVMGIVFAATYIGLRLGEEPLREAAAQLLQSALQLRQETQYSDIISGNAGAIVALLILADISEGSFLCEYAVRLGDELLERADLHEEQCSWKSANFPKQRALTGFSHGTAGIGYALLELFRATDEEKYRTFAERAFSYERQWFDQEMKNWPDFRGVPAQSKGKNYPRSFPVLWCHGAAGIALSRLRAYKILHDEAYKAEALTALATTKAWTEKMLGVESVNFCLCHGMAGNAQILHTGSQILGQEFSGGRDLAREVAMAGINKYVQGNHRWPFGALGAKSPSLMLGLSGVGHFYLSLHDPAVPSPLMLEHEIIRGRLEGRVKYRREGL